jgi:hypothetical protein
MPDKEGIWTKANVVIAGLTLILAYVSTAFVIHLPPFGGSTANPRSAPGPHNVSPSAPSTTSAAPAATPTALSGPTPTRIVLFKGGGDAAPVGPAVQPAGQWTVSTAPAKITTTNYGTLVEDTGLGPIGDCAAQCGEWWYDPRPSVGQLREFYWDETNGQQVLATNLVPALASNNEWASLGDGTYTPLCLSWVVTAGNNTSTLHYIKLSLDTHDWSEISLTELSTC